MTFEKPKLDKFDMDANEGKSLMCQVAGCGKRWSVNMGWRKCSEHAWGKEPDYGLTKMPGKVVFSHPPVKPFTEVDDHGPY
jgi:hypothetical protein